ncbi:hypothetical protein MKEN_00735800 [Mycena kentingensis (nom. inval.)]|nr:hypothetical protein MKEN_00735800 [Mycena kentingensis (nom. inval.)]
MPGGSPFCAFTKVDDEQGTERIGAIQGCYGARYALFGDRASNSLKDMRKTRSSASPSSVRPPSGSATPPSRASPARTPHYRSSFCVTAAVGDPPFTPSHPNARFPLLGPACTPMPLTSQHASPPLLPSYRVGRSRGAHRVHWMQLGTHTTTRTSIPSLTSSGSRVIVPNSSPTVAMYNDLYAPSLRRVIPARVAS